MLFALKADAVATPEALVVAVVVAVPLANVPEAPVAGAVKVTEAFGTGLPEPSFTSAASGVENEVVTWADCGDPAETATCAGALAVFVSEKSAGAEIPETEAVTEYGPPAVVFALKADAVAIPEVLVVAVVVAVELAKVPEAPVAGAVNVTVTPGTGFPEPSFTSAAICVAKAVPTVADCTDPAETVTCDGEPTVLVSEKSAGEVTPVTAPVTV